MTILLISLTAKPTTKIFFKETVLEKAVSVSFQTLINLVLTTQYEQDINHELWINYVQQYNRI